MSELNEVRPLRWAAAATALAMGAFAANSLLCRLALRQDLIDPASFASIRLVSGAVTLIQRFGSAANLNIHLHCLVLDGVYWRRADGAPAIRGSARANR